MRLLITLLLILNIPNVYAMTQSEAKRFLFCEDKSIKLQQLEIRLDKDQKNNRPFRTLQSTQKKIDYIKRVIGRYCE